MLNSQTLIEFGKFPIAQSDSVPILTDDLLQKINWEAIKEYCDTSKLHHTYTRKDSLITHFEYIEQGYVSHFKITSYKGFVLQYDSEISSNLQQSRTSYFDKNVWMIYVSDMLPNLPETFKLPQNEPQIILKSYYRLLGVNTRDEYGWICEYSAAGRAPDKRLAVIDLIKYNRNDLLKKLINYHNVQTKLYAIDALIYLDLETKKKVETAQIELKQQQEKLGGLRNLDNADKDEIESIKSSIKTSKGLIKYLEGELLTKKDWKGFYEFRDSKQIIRTCRNSGSYKVYQKSTLDLLSDKAINEMPKNYSGLKRIGYL